MMISIELMPKNFVCDKRAPMQLDAIRSIIQHLAQPQTILV